MLTKLLCRKCSSLVAKDASSLCTRGSMIVASHYNISTFCVKPSIPSGSRYFGDKSNQSTTDLHSLYLEQMNEINSDREAVFGPSDPTLESQDISELAKTYAEQQESIENNPREPPEWNAEEVYAEREALYQFTSEEKHAWSNYSSSTPLQLGQQKLMIIKEALAQREREEHAESVERSPETHEVSQFTHLNRQQDTISMVDVGDKNSTRRTANARSVVVFPPEVISAFELKENDMIGPKGPIFETARLAGIMGAKKTSDLIPLCHPLPLDKVHINIQLVDNKAIIECECKATHKTGVEMEALTGATIAALTIYDMVKAVSHRVEIGQTLLISKSGGKSDFVVNNN